MIKSIPPRELWTNFSWMKIEQLRPDKKASDLKCNASFGLEVGKETSVNRNRWSCAGAFHFIPHNPKFRDQACIISFGFCYVNT